VCDTEGPANWVGAAGKMKQLGFSLTLAIGKLFFNIDGIQGYGNDAEVEKAD
jgi:hypothetical protein